MTSCTRAAGGGRAIVIDDAAERARILTVTGRRALVATGYDAEDAPGTVDGDLPAVWGVSVVDFTQRRAVSVPDSLDYRPHPREFVLTAGGDVLWSERGGYATLRLFRGGRITDLDAARTRSTGAGRVTAAGDRVRWTPPGLSTRRYSLATQLRRTTTCFPRGGDYLVAGDFGLVRVIDGSMYVCAPGPARRTRIGGACAPRVGTDDAAIAWNDHLTWACRRGGVEVVHVYAFSSRSLLLRQPTNLVEVDGVELTLSEFGAVAWVDKPARGGKLTTMRVFAPGQGLRSFDEGGERVADPSWTGRTVTWLWFRTTWSPDVARSHTVP
ncbi:hypothetical protein LRS13_05440 [Svornostia abyssi]|uniref:Uncharacterized protein n=1 Tax=Svornostia abyssi TaxID=2898438 RepID=A0ABY5PJU5_9ACTN|nr:hypothetical protein LRS13_05440 [Parviterribacteraceae bacterium J379]